MVEQLKFLVQVIRAMVESLPQYGTDAAGKSTMIPSAQYAALIGAGVGGVIKGAGYSIPGFSETQLAGASSALVELVLAYDAAPRVTGA